MKYKDTHINTFRSRSSPEPPPLLILPTAPGIYPGPDHGHLWPIRSHDVPSYPSRRGLAKPHLHDWTGAGGGRYHIVLLLHGLTQYPEHRLLEYTSIEY